MISIRDILTEYDVDHVGEEHPRGRPGWIQIDCPDCNPDTKKFYFGISLISGASNCWKCGRKSTSRILSIVTGQPIQTIQSLLNTAIPEPLRKQKRGKITIPKGVGSLLPGHRDYIESRGFDVDEIIRFWGIQGIGQTTHLKWRLFIPVYHHGIIVSWTTRTINPNERKRYISAPPESETIPIKNILYGSDYARMSIIIHEGPVDVWATGAGAVAICGIPYTPAQVKEMLRYPVRVVCFDSGPEAQAQAQELTRTLSLYPGVTWNVKLESGEDPASADREEIHEMRKKFLE
jgi:hypothetical protein